MIGGSLREHLLTPTDAYTIRPDGGLMRRAEYVAWNPEDECATLYGRFTHHDLRFIADHMERRAKTGEQTAC